MKYNVGDRVRIKSIDWYNENKNKYGNINCGYMPFTSDMSIYCGAVLTICDIKDEFSYYHIKKCNYMFTDEMIEGLVEEEEIEFTEEDKYWCDIMSESDPTTYILPEGYIFKDENDNVINATKIVLEKKQNAYPKTYEECAKIMNCPIAGPSGWLFNFDANIKDTYYRKIDILMGKFTRLLICRDAYWKLYGEEKGLGKPWEPDLLDDNQPKFVLANWDDNIEERDYSTNRNYILAFPTAEMRDAFYENFKELIEQCKELL